MNPDKSLKRTAWLMVIATALLVLPHSASAAGGGGAAKSDAAWWDAAWTGRKSLDVLAPEGGRPTGAAVTLVRLHSGNFPFGMLKGDGSDLRVVADDQKTAIPFHLERYDSLMNEAFLWLRLPTVAEGTDPTKVWLYFGNAAAENAGSSKETYPEPAVLVYHFAENGSPPRDYSTKENAGLTAPTPTEGALIGAGMILFGTNGIEIPASESLNWTANGEATLMVWVKPSAAAPNAAIYHREENGASFTLGVDNGIPYVEIGDTSGKLRSSAGEPIGEGAYRHLAAIATSGKTDLYLDGKIYGSVPRGLPALTSAAYMGGTPEAGGGFVGEVDEFQIHAAALEAPLVKFLAATQSGSPESQQLVAIGADEGGGGGGHNETLEHLMLFGDIANNMMFDGWVAIGVCIIMMIVGGVVAVKKFLYLNSIQKGTESFMKMWSHVSSDLTALDHLDADSVKTMGGKASAKALRDIRRSPLYHLYHIGCQEIGHRIKDRESHTGLSARSMQAIRSSLDSGLVRENHRMNGGLIFLTISIAGGPYVGLLGTVVGVMITFAIISKSGEVEVASIAPGIASALLATVFGLLVAIPALFIYSYLSTRIKDLLSSMQIFIDEFIAKMAEIYPPVSDIVETSPSAVTAPDAGRKTTPSRPKTEAAVAVSSGNSNHDSHAS